MLWQIWLCVATLGIYTFFTAIISFTHLLNILIGLNVGWFMVTWKSVLSQSGGLYVGKDRSQIEGSWFSGV